MPLVQVLRKFDVIAYRDADPGVDRRQVPADGARFDFYQQGATSRTDIEIPPTTAREVGVWYPGTIEGGDQLQVDTDPSALLRVEQIVLPVGGQVPASLILRNEHATQPVIVGVGQRLLRLNARPIAQQDPTGGAASGDSFVLADPMGRATCYLLPFLFDVLLSGAGVTERVFPDCEGSFVMRTS